MSRHRFTGAVSFIPDDRYEVVGYSVHDGVATSYRDDVIGFQVSHHEIVNQEIEGRLDPCVMDVDGTIEVVFDRYWRTSNTSFLVVRRGGSIPDSLRDEAFEKTALAEALRAEALKKATAQ